MYRYVYSVQVYYIQLLNWTNKIQSNLSAISTKDDICCPPPQKKNYNLCFIVYVLNIWYMYLYIILFSPKQNNDMEDIVGNVYIKCP